MAQVDSTTNSKRCKHLDRTERQLIERWLKEGVTIKEIADRLGRTRQTIHNEIRRGSADQIRRGRKVSVYFADLAQRRHDGARANCGAKLKLAKCPRFMADLEEAVRHGISPDAYRGRADLEGAFPGEDIPSTPTLYSYIDNGILRTRIIDLWEKAGRKVKPQKARQRRKELGDSIDLRPARVALRELPGDWEIDTIIGARGKGPCLLSLDERKTRFRILVLIPSRSAEAVNAALRRAMAKLGEWRFRSITADNGSEFSTYGLYAIA